MMSKWIAYLLLAITASTAVARAHCAASCAVRECANHPAPRPSDSPSSNCPHNTPPDQKSGPDCPQMQLMGESWLVSTSLPVFHSVDLSWAAAASPPPAVLPETALNRRIGCAVSNVSTRSSLLIQLRI